VSWTAPDSGGSAITGYTVLIVQNDGSTYSEEVTNCGMGTNTATSCVIPVSALRSAPFSLDWGKSVYAKIIALNAYGGSAESVAGNGAVIIT